MARLVNYLTKYDVDVCMSGITLVATSIHSTLRIAMNIHSLKVENFKRFCHCYSCNTCLSKAQTPATTYIHTKLTFFFAATSDFMHWFFPLKLYFIVGFVAKTIH